MLRIKEGQADSKMVLYFEKVREEDNLVIYRYSRETGKLDGEITWDRETGKTTVTVPCSGDAGSWIALSMAQSHFARVVEDGFPARRKVVSA